MTLKDGLRMQKQRQKCMRAHADMTKKISFRSHVSSQWVASPLRSLVFTDACHVTMKRQERGRAWHRFTPPTPQWRASRIERCSWSLRSAAGLISPSYPLLVPPGSMRLEADVSVISVHLLVREGSSSLMHYSHMQHQPRQIISRQGKATITLAQWLNKNEKAYNSCSFTLLWLILYGDMVVTIMWHVIVCPLLEWS